MAHFAKLKSDNVIQDIVVLNNDILLNEANEEIEQKGIDLLKQLYGADTVWIQTSYNDNFRKQYARIGGTYNEDLDIFINPKPAASWSLDENNDWVAPIPKPDGGGWIWDEDAYQSDNLQGWVQL